MKNSLQFPTTELPTLRLGYVGIEVSNLDEWEKLGREALGFDTTRTRDGLFFRLDDHLRRLILKPGPRDDVVYLGWEVDDLTALETMRRHLSICDIPATDLNAAALELRGIRHGIAFTGPAGLPCEIYCDAIVADKPLQLHGMSGFVAGDSGIGHIALLTKNLQQTQAEFAHIMGARHTDDIVANYLGIGLHLRFLHFNERHHSVALAEFKADMPPSAKLLAHIMLEAASIDDVGAACARCKDFGYVLPMDIGKHTNDRAISFYVATPSGFDIEIGCNAVIIEDEAKWKPTTYDAMSLWGHQRYPD